MIFKCGTHELWKCILMADRSNTCLIYRVWSLWNCSFNGGSRRHLPFGSLEIESKSGGEIRVCCFGRPSSVSSKDFCTNVRLEISNHRNGTISPAYNKSYEISRLSCKTNWLEFLFWIFLCLYLVTCSNHFLKKLYIFCLKMSK